MKPVAIHHFPCPRKFSIPNQHILAGTFLSTAKNAAFGDWARVRWICWPLKGFRGRPMAQQTNAPKGSHSNRRRTVSKSQYRQLLAKCRELPAIQDGPGSSPIEDDYVTNLMITVLDLRLESTTVERALDHFRRNQAAAIRTQAELRAFLGSSLSDHKLAKSLWGYGYGHRIEMLRGLVDFFDSIGVTDQSTLRAWAKSADFELHFRGRVKGLAYAAFKWLLMRVGTQTVKPDVHVLRFVERSLGYRLGDSETVSLLERIARDLGISASELDGRIWLYGRGRPRTRLRKTSPAQITLPLVNRNDPRNTNDKADADSRKVFQFGHKALD